MKVGPVNVTIEGLGPRGKFVLALIAFDVVVGVLLGIVLLVDESAPIAAVVEAPIAQTPTEGAGGGRDSAAWFALGGALGGVALAGVIAFANHWFFDRRERRRRGFAALDQLILEFGPFTMYVGLAIDAKVKGDQFVIAQEGIPDASFPAFHRSGPEISAVVSPQAWARIRRIVGQAPLLSDLRFVNNTPFRWTNFVPFRTP